MKEVHCSLQKDGALDSLNLELGTIAAASPKAGLELGALLRQPSLEGSTGAREVLKRSMAGKPPVCTHPLGSFALLVPSLAHTACSALSGSCLKPCREGMFPWAKWQVEPGASHAGFDKALENGGAAPAGASTLAGPCPANAIDGSDVLEQPSDRRGSHLSLWPGRNWRGHHAPEDWAEIVKICRPLEP